MIKMIHYNILLLPITLFLGIASVALSAESMANDKPRPLIITTIKPLAIIAKSAVADAAEVDFLMPSNQSPHHYSLPVSALKRIAQADLVIWIGPTFESRSTKAISALLPDRRLTALGSASQGAEQFVDHDHSHHLATDPHIWLSPAKANALAAKIQQHLGLPEKPVLSNQQWAQLSSELAQVKSETFISHHDAYGHFVEAFGMRPGLSIRDSSGAAQGVKSQYQLRHKVANAGASCVIVEPQYLDKDIAVIAEEFGLPTVMMDLQGTDQPLSHQAYAEFISGLVAQFKACFG